MVVYNEAGVITSAEQAAANVASVLRRVFIADQNYYTIKPQPQSRIFQGGMERRLVLYKGQAFSEARFKLIFGSVPEDTVRPPTPEEVQQAVSNYLMMNPPAKGDKGDKGDAGTPATNDQVSAALGAYFTANPVVPPAPLAPTPQQIADAVSAYLVAHPPAKGDKGDTGSQGLPGGTGPQGPAPTDAQVIAAANAYLAANVSTFRGLQGIQGIQGNPGTPADMTRVTALETWQTSATASITAIQAALTTLQSYIVGKGTFTIASNLIIGGTGNATVTWDTGFKPADANYWVICAQDTGSPYAIDVIGPPTSKGVNTCSVPIKNVGSLAAGAGFVFRAIAVKY